MKCELCGIREYFRVCKGLKMCINCYSENIRTEPHGANIKATQWDEDNLIYKKHNQ